MGAVIMPKTSLAYTSETKPMTRVFGKLGLNVTTLGLGGMSSLQWTPERVHPVKIILKAFDLGINFFDTSNVYGTSQEIFGQAFRLKNLVPGMAGYNETLRKSVYITSKTHLRYAKGYNDENIFNQSNGGNDTHAIDDLRRLLSLMFGDGKGNYPAGAYLDLFLIHDVRNNDEVDAVYEGFDHPDPAAERIGALAALRDYRDGTNLTGLNTKKEKLIRHIGFSGHADPSVNMYMIRRDKTGILDAMLVATNANDKIMFNFQYNAIPVAMAKNMGIIGMKVFADGAMYTKVAAWSSDPKHVVLKVGSESLSSHSLVRYALTIPGVHVVITGIGKISDNFPECQLSNNLFAAQVLPDALSEAERKSIETAAGLVKEGLTNYYQVKAISLKAPSKVTALQAETKGVRTVTIKWNTAYAGDAALAEYTILRDGLKAGSHPFQPQTTMELLSYPDEPGDYNAHSYTVRITDAKGRNADSEPVGAQAMTPAVTAVDEANGGDTEILVYPNPADNYINLEFGNIDHSGTTYQLLDINGATLERNLIDGGKTTIDISNLPPAGYFLKITRHGKILKVLKMLKVRV